MDDRETKARAFLALADSVPVLFDWSAVMEQIKALPGFPHWLFEGDFLADDTPSPALCWLVINLMGVAKGEDPMVAIREVARGG